MRDYIDTDYLILVSSDGKKAGLEIFRDRIKKNKWPIYNKTPQLLNVKPGKNVIFYIAGTGERKQSFVGTAKIKKKSMHKMMCLTRIKNLEKFYFILNLKILNFLTNQFILKITLKSLILSKIKKNMVYIFKVEFAKLMKFLIITLLIVLLDKYVD